MRATQRHDIEAWLGDNHGLTDEQIDDLLDTARELDTRYPHEDESVEKEAALTVTYRLMSGQQGVVEELASELAAARAAEVSAFAGLRQAALMLITPGGSETESGFARKADVDRMTVRKWRGKKR